MSEVKRYHVTDAGLVEGQALGRINVVLGPDYDSAVQCFLTAAEGCVAAERRERALQALLTAADERADTATSLIQRIVANFDTEIEFHEDVEPNDLEHDQVLADMRVFLGALKPAEPKEGPHLILDICGMPIHACEFMAALGITYQLAVPQSMSDTWWFFNCENVRSSRPSRLRVLDKTAQQCVGWGLSQHMADEIKARCKLPLKPVNLDVSFKPGTGGNHD